MKSLLVWQVMLGLCLVVSLVVSEIWGSWLTATQMNGKIWTGQKPQGMQLRMQAGRDAPNSLWMEPIFWVMVVSLHTLLFHHKEVSWKYNIILMPIMTETLKNTVGCTVIFSTCIWKRVFLSGCELEWLIVHWPHGLSVRRLLLPLPITRLLFHLDKWYDDLIGWCERSHHYFVTTYSSPSSTVTFKYLTKHFIPKSSSQVSNSVFMLHPALLKLPLHLLVIFCLFQVIWRLMEMFSEEGRILRFLWSSEPTNWIHF